MAAPVLRQLLDALGPSRLRLVTDAAGAGTPVSGVLIHEPRAVLTPVRHALLLAVGIRPAGADMAGLVRQAAQAGYAGLVIKCYGEPAADLVTAATGARLAVLTVDEDMAWHHLDALLSAALAALTRPALGGTTPGLGDLFALANAIAGMVGGATTMEDPHQRVLAYSTLPGQPIDEDRRQGILGLQVPDVPVNEEQYRELSRTAKVCRFTAGPGSLPRLAVAVRAGGDVLGSIWVVDPAGDMGPAAEQALAEAASTAALHMLAARSAADLGRQHSGDLLRRVLADPASAAFVAPQLALSPDAPVAVAAFTAIAAGPAAAPGAAAPGAAGPGAAGARADPAGAGAAHTAMRLVDLVNLHCEAHYGRHGCVLVDGIVYALLPGAVTGQPHRDLIADIARRAQRALRVPIRAGLGAQVPGLRWAASSREDADLVLRVLASRPAQQDGPVVASIEELRASATLAELAEVLSEFPRVWAGHGAGIMSHDAEHGTAYASTLLAYLDANSDIGQAARQLNVHPNTCRYRLTRAGEIFGFTLANPDERLLLWLQLRLS